MSSKISLPLFISLAFCVSFLTGCRRNSIPSPEPVTGNIDQSSGSTTLPSNVQIGSTVTIKYTITTADQAVRKQQDNETIVIGQNTLNAYVESQLVGMQKNEEKKILVNPMNGFGTMYDFEKEERLPISVFTSANLTPQSGQRYNLGGTKGYVIGFSGQNNEIVIFNTNPIYTWKDITYSVTILDIK